MKTIIETKASRKLGADHIIKAVLLDVGSPPPSEPDKQPIVLCLPPGDIKMGCNLIGKHLHIDPREKGNVIWITSKKDGACYVSYFPDENKFFLTVRDGVQIHFRPLSPDIKMHNPKDRLPYLALHYRECWEKAMIAMAGMESFNPELHLPGIATALWLETKAGVLVPPTQPVPMSEPKEEVATPEPEKPKEDVEILKPVEDPKPEAAKEEIIQKHYDKYAKWDYSKVCETAKKAMVYTGPDPTVPFKRQAISNLLDDLTAGKEPKAWLDVYDEIWQSQNDAVKKLMDDAVAACFEKKPDIVPSAAHKIVCLCFPEITTANEKI